MDANNANNHRLALYAIYVAVDGILVETIAQSSTSSAHENKKRLLISLAALVMNVVVAVWVFSDIQPIYWKAVIIKAIFIFTGILSPYAAFSMLEPEWFTWHGFATIFAIVIIVEGYIVLQLIYSWFYQRYIVAKNYLIGKLSEAMMLTRELPMHDVV